MTPPLCAEIYSRYFPSIQLSLVNFWQFPLSVSKIKFGFFSQQIYYVSPSFQFLGVIGSTAI